MRRFLAGAALFGSLFWASTAGAPPPLPSFPANLRPLSGNAPHNTKIWAFGSNAPPLSQVAINLTIDGNPAPVTTTSMGCCAVAATITTPRAGTATVVVTSPAATLDATFLIGPDDDTTAPTLRPATLLEDLAGRLIIGVDGTDDMGLAGFLARVDGEVRGSAPPGYLLDSVRGSDGCVSITAVDLAGNESAPATVCGMRPDAGVREDAGDTDGGAEVPEEGCDCTTTRPGASWLGLALLGASFFFLSRRASARVVAARTRDAAIRPPTS